MSALNEHDEDVIGSNPRTGEPITRRQWREGLESTELETETLLLEMRRMLETDLSDEHLKLWQRLFKTLGQKKNPIIIVSWWEGQIDFAAHLRERDAALQAASSGPIPDTLHVASDNGADADLADEVESAVVEGTLDRHDFDPDPDWDLPGQSPTCIFTASTGMGVFVCGLFRTAPPHRFINAAPDLP